MKQIQVSQGPTKQTVWVDREDDIKVGCEVTFKGENDRWKVDAIYDTVIERKEINRTWHVGGL